MSEKIGLLSLPPKMTTRDYRTRLTDVSPALATWSRVMCWEAVLDAFGVSLTSPTRKPKPVKFINGKLTDHGYELRRLRDTEVAPLGIVATFAVFMQAHLTGDYLVYTCDHVVAIRDGRITDTTGKCQSVKRRVEYAYKVTKKQP